MAWEDSDAAFEAAIPRGGLVPAGLAGRDQGRCGSGGTREEADCSMYVYVCVHINIYTYVHMYVCVCRYIYRYMYRHTVS